MMDSIFFKYYEECLHSRMSQIENTLLDLNKEIINTSAFLHNLKEFSAKIVRQLNNKSPAAVYFKEFSEVNSLLLKYLIFLREINCKFEVFQIVEHNKPDEAEKITLISDELDNSIFNSSDFMSIKRKYELKVLQQMVENPLVYKPSNLESSILPKLQETNLKKNKELLNPKHFQVSITNSENSNLGSEVPSITRDVTTCNAYEEKLLQAINEKKSKKSKNKETKFDSFDLINSSSHISLLQNKINRNVISQKAIVNQKLGLSDSNPEVSVSDNFDQDEVSKDLHINFTASVQSTLAKENNECSLCNVGDKKNHINFSAEENIVQNENNIQLSVVKKNEKEKQELEVKVADVFPKLGDEFEVIIQHIKSPSEFYVHIINHELNLLEELEKKLKLIPSDNKIIKNQKKECKKAFLSKEIGIYALYYSKCDEMWYRAKVVDWCSTYNNDFVYIFLLDYGESKYVSIDSLQPIPEFLKKYPAFAKRCHLQGLYPVDMSENKKCLTWGKESSEKMRHLIEKSKKIKIKIGPNDDYHPPSSFPVELWLVDKGNKNINNILVKTKYAVEKIYKKDLKCDNTKEIFLNDYNSDSKNFKNYNLEKEDFVSNCNLEVKNFENWNPMKEDFESYQNLYDLNINDPAAVIYGYINKDYDRICKHFAKTGKCFKGETCKKEHNFIDPSGYTTDQEEVYKNAFNILPIPSLNEIFSVQVTCLLDINQFCCISEYSKHYYDEENLFTLIQFMNNNENVREMQMLLIPPTLGQIVIAQFSEDEFWYRAKILESEPENDRYTILFVDYGNKEDVPLSRIRAIEARYLHLPFQAMHCHIFGVQKNSKVSLKESLKYLNEKIRERPINIEVILKLPGDDINLLVNVFDECGENIGEDLIAKGYAMHKDEIIITNDCEILPG